MKIIHVAAEVLPYAKTGGLADVLGALPTVLSGMGNEVAVALPLYRAVDREKHGLQTVIPSLAVPLGDSHIECQILKCMSKGGLAVYFIACDPFFDRDKLYGYADDAERFIVFDRAVIEMLKSLDWHPDIIHCHDWQTGLIPAFLKSLYADGAFYRQTASVYSIHNLAYQGAFPGEGFPLLRLPYEMFNYHELEFYGQVNPMKAGLVFADAVVTVSERYAKEIQTPDYGEGLDAALRERKDSVHGILNGIDYEKWNPGSDTLIHQTYDAVNSRGKAENKRFLQERGGLARTGRTRVPVIGCVSRLSSQKGFDLIEAAAPQLMNLEMQFVLLGAGDGYYTKLFEDMARRYPQQTYITLGRFDNELAHQIYAGSDFFLMPSRYEPCGLGQLISLAYGTIPIVRATGGLADTIEEYIPGVNTGNGFRFDEYSPDALYRCIERAVKIYRFPPRWKPLVENALHCDFSWDVSARKYLDLYQQTLCTMAC